MHALYYHSRLLPMFRGLGLDVVSNDLRHGDGGLGAHWDWAGLVRLPIGWEDDVHCARSHGLPPAEAFDISALGLRRSGLKVFNFHPIHLYLNTADLAADYLAHKPVLRNHEAAHRIAERQRQRPGVRTLFLQLVSAIRERGLLVASCRDLADSFVQSGPRPAEHRRYEAFLADAEALSAPGERPQEAS